MKFKDREEAGRLLGHRLLQYLRENGIRGHDCLVVGLPRGGVPVALEIATQLKCPLEVIVSKKLPYPGQAEYAIGAVSSDGVVFLNPEIPNSPEWTKYIEAQRQQLLAFTKRVEDQFYAMVGKQRPSSFKDKVVIVVDDGIATGMTAVAAIESAKRRGARQVIIAAPVMSRDSYAQLQNHADSAVAFDIPLDFVAVGTHYFDFKQTSDEEVIEALRKNVGMLGRTAGDNVA